MSQSSTLRELILRETRAAIREQGYFGVSLRRIAAGAGVHPGTIGALFGDKKRLLAAAERSLCEPRLEAAEQP